MSPDLESISGIAHTPTGPVAGVVVLTHGAGGSRESPLLIAVCDEWAARGWLAIRYNLPYRRRRPKGPPSGTAADLAGIAEALTCARSIAVDVVGTGGPVIAGGHSYGGRLTSMLIAAQPGIADELTLFSYPRIRRAGRSGCAPGTSSRSPYRRSSPTAAPTRSVPSPNCAPQSH